jgi:hypothetical protein
MRPGYREIWLDAARELGAEATEVGGGFMELRRGDAWALVWNSWVPLDDAVTLRFAEEKTLARTRLEAAGLPVPGYALFEFSDLSPGAAPRKRDPRRLRARPSPWQGGSKRWAPQRDHFASERSSRSRLPTWASRGFAKAKRRPASAS